MTVATRSTDVHQKDTVTARAVSKEWTRARIVDELLYLLRTSNPEVDYESGHKRSKYEKKGEFVLHRINLYKPSPMFTLDESDLSEDLRRELLSLDNGDLDDVMREAIYQLLDELNTSDFRVFVKRRDIRWKIHS
jgi:hypothetical protein